jgi:hypothetical protein
MRTLFRILFLCLMCTSGALQAQNTMSPYSIFGPGEIQPKGFGRSAGMGHAGIALRSDARLNNLNPASYSGIDSLHFILEMGVDGKFSGFRSQGNSKTGFNSSLQYVALGFRINNRWASSLGITPFSNVGYDIVNLDYVEGSDLRYITRYKGSGGITLAYWGNSVRVAKNFSLGVNSSYIFGPLVQEEYISQNDLDASYILTRTDHFHSLYFEYGAQYSFKIKKLNFALGAVYANTQNLISGYSSILQTSNLGTIDSETGKKGIRKMPETMGGGIAISHSDRFTLALDFQLQKWAGIKYPTMTGAFKNADNYAAGIEFKPWNLRVGNRFYQNWTYRTGFNYYSSYLKINSQPVNGYSATLGLGIPLRNQYSQINVAFEAGTKGTTNNGLIRENFFMGHLNMTINEVWFLKRIYD